MEPVLSGIKGLAVLSRVDRGTFVRFELTAETAQVEAVLAALLECLPEGADISVPEPGSGECYRECQRIDGVLMIKRGCHGSYGTWKPAGGVEAGEWLLPGFRQSVADAAAERVQLCIPQASGGQP